MLEHLYEGVDAELESVLYLFMCGFLARFCRKDVRKKILNRLLEEEAKKWKKELEEKGVDFENDDYVNNEIFIKSANKMFEYYIPTLSSYDIYGENSDNGKISFRPFLISYNWLVEKYFIGQERLEKIYGKYALCINRKLAPSESTLTALCDYLVENNIAYDIDNLNLWFTRNQTGGNKDNKSGLINRLCSWGIDVSKFENNCDEKVRLYYFLFNFEKKHNMRAFVMLENPTLENVDESIVNHDTKNGMYISELKDEILKGITYKYAFSVYETLIQVISPWERLIQDLHNMLLNPDISYDEIKNIERNVTAYLNNLPPNNDNEYEDSLLETFYLKLCQHENIGRICDILSLEQDSKYTPVTHENTISLGEITIIEQSEVADKLKSDKKDIMEFLQINDKDKYDRLIKNVPYFVEMVHINANINDGGKIIWEVILIFLDYYNKKGFADSIDNKFYRYKKSTDNKTLRSEIPFGFDAFIKNQAAIVMNVYHCFYDYIGRSKEYDSIIKIEIIIDQIINKILSCNSIRSMINFHMKHLLEMKILCMNSDVLKKAHELIKNINGFLIKGYTFRCSEYNIKKIFFVLYNTSILDKLICIINYHINNNLSLEFPFECSIEKDYIKYNFHLDIKIKPDTHEINIDYIHYNGYCESKDEEDENVT